MVQYICELCNYITNRKYSYDVHLQSNKHKNIYKSNKKSKVNNNSNNYNKNEKSNEKYLCRYCNNIFIRLSNRTRHEKICMARLYEEKIKEYENKLKEKENETYTLKKILEEKNESLVFHRKKELTDQRLISRNVFKCIVKNLNPPILEKPKPRKMFRIPSKNEDNKISNLLIDDEVSLCYSENSDVSIFEEDEDSSINKNQKKEQENQEEVNEDNYFDFFDDSDNESMSPDSENEPISERENIDLIKEINSKYIHKTLHFYIGKKIVDYYVKDNIRDQAIWISDVNRLTFIISQEIDGNNKFDWVIDRKGNILGEIIVDPILSHIKNQILRYHSYTVDNELFNSNEVELLHNLMKINLLIEHGHLKSKVLRYISPRFSFNANDLLYLE